MKKLITENELASRSAGLREKMAQLESQQTDEGWFDDAVGGVKKFFGGGAQPAAAPAAAQATPVAPPGATPSTPLGKPGEAPQAQAAAGAGTTPPPAQPANAKAQQYNTALKQIKDLYAKAKVQYPPQDDIVRQRYGLPPALPPLEKWDGKMPEAGQADWLTRNVLGRDASKAVAGQQAANNISNTANAKSDAETEADVKQLTTLVAQLKAGLEGKGPAPVSLSQSAPAAATPGTPAAGVAFNQGKAYGGYGQGPAPATLAESIASLTKKIRLMETPMSQDPAQKAAAAAPPPLDTTGKDDIIKKIQELMTKINGNNEDPPQDVAQALSDAQAAIDQFKAAAAEQAKNGTPPVSLAQSNGVDAQGNNVGIQGMDGSMINPETGDKYSTGINPETGEKYTPLGAGTPSAASIISNSPVVQASQSAAAPAKAINPETGEEYTPVSAFNQGAQGTRAPAQVAQKKYGGYGQFAENVGYSDEQALARIVELSRR
jgi:hypothetical protein